MPRSTKQEKEKKRRVVARGVVAAKKTRQIAKEAKCSERQVERLVKEPATEFLIASLMRPHHARLTKLAKKAIDAVAGALEAKTTRGHAVHEIRLRAVGRYGELLHLAQGDKPPEGDGLGLVTWEEFVVLYRSRKGNDGGNKAGTAPSKA